MKRYFIAILLASFQIFFYLGWMRFSKVNDINIIERNQNFLKIELASLSKAGNSADDYRMVKTNEDSTERMHREFELFRSEIKNY